MAKRGPAPAPAPRGAAAGGEARVPFGDLSRQIESIRAELDAAAARVLDRGWFILGEEVEAFEREFAAHTGTRHAIGVASGTEAIALALAALGIGPGDEVITASATAVPTAAAVVQIGAAPVFADVDDSLTLDPESVAAALGPRTRAILPVHLYGQPADLAELGAIAKSHGLPIVEDASQAHDAEIGGRKAGAVGALGCFSFYPSKNLGALGDAGAVTTSDAALGARVRSLRNYGQTRRDHSELPGINSRLDELQAAFLRVKLPRLEGWTKRREALARMYDDLLGDVEGVRLAAVRSGARHARHLYAIEAERRDALREHLAARGIEALIHYGAPVHRQPAYTAFRNAPGGLARTEAWAAATLSLPLYPELREDEVARVAEAVRAFYEA